MNSARNILLWSVPLAVIIVAVVAAALSPQLAWRRPVYIASGFAGIFGMALLLIQPLLADRYFPGVSARRGRQIHRLAGSLLVIAVIGHVIGLWITSPPDMIDALLLRSPTPFSIWGVLAMWAIFGAAFLAIFKGRLNLRHQTWRAVHFTLATGASISSVVHAMQIEGTMETVTKTALCALVLWATAKVGYDLRIWKFR